MKTSSGLFFIICIGLLYAAPSAAQLKTTATPDELRSALSKSNPDTRQVQLLLQLSTYYYFERDTSRGSLDSVLLYLQQAEQLSAAVQSTKWLPEIDCFLGKYYYKTGNITRANDYFQKIGDYIKNSGPVDQQIQRWEDLAWNIEELDTAGLTRVDCFEKIATLYHQLHDKEKEIEQQKEIADTHMKQGNLDLAIRELSEVLAKYQAIGYRHLHYTYHLLSVTHHLKGNYNKALYYAIITVESMQKTNDTANAAWAVIFYSSLAHLYDELGQTKKGIDNYRIIFERYTPHPFDFYMYREAGDFVRDLLKDGRSEEALAFLHDFSKKHPPADQYAKASLARTFAYYYNTVRDHALADKYTREMISLEGSLGRNNEIRGDVEYDIGQYYLGKKQFANAGAHFEIALYEAALNNSSHTIRDIHLMLFRTDSSLGNFVSAIKHLNQYHQLNDSIFNVAKIRQIEEVQAKYEVEKNEQGIKILEKESRLQQVELSKTKTIRNWTLAGTLLLLVIIALLIKNSRFKQRTNQQLEAQSTDLRHLVQEKDWLLKEIHHRVKNNLHMISALLDAQTGFLKNSDALSAIRESQHRVNSMSLIHQKLYQSGNLSLTDMPAYIHDLVAYLEDSFNTGDRIHFKLQIARLELSLTHSIPLGLILNEAITNSIKYAFPDHRKGEVTIKLLRQTDHHFLLYIADDGIGLPPDFNTHAGSMGMSLMRGLSEDIGGSFAIENTEGTKIKVAFVYE